jgi:quercetin dioxygenase-like cupin family protein
MRPDRPEVINERGSCPVMQIAPGIQFECMVGSHNQARRLTTGLVTFAPGAALPYHRHPFGESITLMRGSAVVEVEGRQYVLDEMDNITIPRGLAHHVVNASSRHEAVFNIMLASDSPSRTLVEDPFVLQIMPPQSTGHPGGERITRFHTAPRYEPGSGTLFIDFFNRELIPNIEMSGGYGVFQHGGRLPAHIHDFDESICIVEGVATCVVEGREYTMSNYATALQPRGRVHYFINHTHAPMAMLWVYAGPMPERLVVDECCATVNGNPWRERGESA